MFVQIMPESEFRAFELAKLGEVSVDEAYDYLTLGIWTRERFTEWFNIRAEESYFRGVDDSQSNFCN